MYNMNRGKILISSFFIISVLLLATPIMTMAQSPLVPCGDQTYPEGNMVNGKDVSGTVSNPCEWKHFIIGISNVTNYFIILGAAISALAFGYAGFLMMTASGEMGKIEEAKAIFGKVLIGFLFMLSAWLIVHAINAGFLASGFIDSTVVKPL